MQFLLYCLFGGLGVCTDYAVFYMLVSIDIWYQYANLLGYLAGALTSFSFNRVFTFALRDRVLQRLAMFLMVACTGFFASALLLWVLVDKGQCDARLAKLLTLPLVVALQFSLNRRITFSH